MKRLAIWLTLILVAAHLSGHLQSSVAAATLPSPPPLATQQAWGGSAAAMALVDHEAYVGVGVELQHIRRVDSAWQLQPALVTVDDLIMDVVATDDYLLVVTGRDGVYLFDRTTAIPALVQHWAYAGYLHRAVWHRGAFWIVDWQGALLQLVPAALHFEVVADGWGQATGLAAASNQLYVATGFGGVRIFDVVGNEVQPAGSINTYAWDLFSHDGNLWITTGFAGELSQYGPDGNGGWAAAAQLQTDGMVTAATASTSDELLLATTHGVIHRVALGTATAPTNSIAATEPIALVDMVNTDDGLFVLTPAGFHVREVDSPQDDIAQVSLGGSVVAVAADNGAVASVTTHGQLALHQFGGALVGQINLNQDAHALYWHDDTLLVGTETGIAVVDATDATAPTLQAHITTARPVTALTSDASLVAAVQDRDSVCLWSRTDWTPIGDCTPVANVRDVALAPGLLLVAHWSGVSSYDLADADTPQLRATVAVPGYATGLALNQARLAVATRAGIALIRVASDGALQFISDVATVGAATAVAIEGRFAYVADGQAGVQVIDWLAPASPKLVATWQPAGETVGLHVTSGVVVAALADGGVAVTQHQPIYSLLMPVAASQ